MTMKGILHELAIVKGPAISGAPVSTYSDNSMHKFLNLPAYIWMAEFVYVIIALAVLAFLLKNRGSAKMLNARRFIVGYVTTMIIINIIWRILVSKINN
ncbi:MAG TPA: hypothetical protein VMT96_00630 [Candidatus Bathyarchaeia archaeon]|nr:hypothetical protein [Candidatus Bathyarchaeia archaeon]